MNIKALTAFKYVYTKGSIVSASQYMHLSVSALSRMISNLEYTLQLQLFIREGKQLIPTVEAVEFYPEVERILENIEKMYNVVGDLRAGRTKNLRIISVPKMAQFLSAPAIIEFLKSSTNVNISVNIQPRHEIEKLLVLQEYDIGIGFLPVQDAQTFTKPILSIRSLAILPKNHSLAGEKSISIDMLKNETFIRLIYGLVSRQRIDDIFSHAQIKPTHFIEVSSSQMACALVAQGGGVTIADEMVAEPFKDSVIMIPITPNVWSDVGILYPNQSPNQENIKIFEKLLLHQMKSKLYNSKNVKWIQQ